jgi:integrase/recombinase XerD
LFLYCPTLDSKQEINMNELFDTSTGERLYLNAEERKAFLERAKTKENDVKYFSLMLYYTGCRLNESLGLMVESVDFENQSVIIRSLKKKGKIHYRHIPLPEGFLNELAGAYNLRTRKKNKKNDNEKIWNFTDRTARRYITKIMTEVSISGKKACPKGLRHSFGVAAVENDIPITEIQKLLGHHFLESTQIYTAVKDVEKRNLVV